MSIDGATPESYADVRLGNELPQIIANLLNLKLLYYRSESDLSKMRIAFVAMKRNIVDFPKDVR